MSSIIKTHNHENYNILKEFSEASDSTLLYKGKPITGGSGADITISKETGNAIQEKADGIYVPDLSSHTTESIVSSSGVHGLRYYNSKLQYLNVNKAWVSISTGGGSGGGTGDIIISPSANNVLTKYANGYYVPGFLISPQINNAIQKLSDGYYVPAIPVNNATTDDIDAAMDEIDDKLVEQNQTFNERYDIITTKILQIAGNTTKSQVHKYLGNNPISIDKVIDISTLYNLSSDVILNLEIMIKNTSDVDTLTLKIEENGVETLKDMLTKSEVQRYKLPNIPSISIFIKGSYQLFLYVTYI